MLGLNLALGCRQVQVVTLFLLIVPPRFAPRPMLD